MDKYSQMFLVKVSLRLVRSYVARLVCTIVSLCLVLVGSIVNISACQTPDRQTNSTVSKAGRKGCGNRGRGVEKEKEAWQRRKRCDKKERSSKKVWQKRKGRGK